MSEFRPLSPTVVAYFAEQEKILQSRDQLAVDLDNARARIRDVSALLDRSEMQNGILSKEVDRVVDQRDVYSRTSTRVVAKVETMLKTITMMVEDLADEIGRAKFEKPETSDVETVIGKFVARENRPMVGETQANIADMEQLEPKAQIIRPQDIRKNDEQWAVDAVDRFRGKRLGPVVTLDDIGTNRENSPTRRPLSEVVSEMVEDDEDPEGVDVASIGREFGAGFTFNEASKGPVQSDQRPTSTRLPPNSF